MPGSFFQNLIDDCQILIHFTLGPRCDIVIAGLSAPESFFMSASANQNYITFVA